MGEVAPPRPLLETDDRKDFDCGQEALNRWFDRHAWNNQIGGFSRTNVICSMGSDRIVGFVSMCAAQIERSFLPKAQQRNRPNPVPVTLLGQLAVHKDHQRKGHARSLLLFALHTALVGSRHIGSYGVLTHPLDDSVRNFYARYDFEILPFDPGRAMLVRMIDLSKSADPEP